MGGIAEFNRRRGKYRRGVLDSRVTFTALVGTLLTKLHLARSRLLNSLSSESKSGLEPHRRTTTAP